MCLFSLAPSLVCSFVRRRCDRVAASEQTRYGRMRHIVCTYSASAISPVITSRPSLLLQPLMNFRGAQSGPIQPNRNSAADADALYPRFHSLSDGEIIQRNRNLQQLVGGGGGGGGGAGLSSGEANSRWNLEQQQQQQEPRGWRGDGEQQRRERRVWRKVETAGWEDAPGSGAENSSASCFRGGRGGARVWWGGRQEGRGLAGDGRRGGRRHHVGSNNNGWERRPANGDTRLDGEFTRSRYDEDRHWCYAESELPGAPHEKFVLLSYNILADKNAFEHYNELYYPTPRWLLSWGTRRSKLVEELGFWSADIMCLQEVDKYDDLREDFERMGYRGAYKGRTGDARDGCAIFWKTTRFVLLEELSIQFNDLDLRNNVAQLCVFQSIAGSADQDLNSESQHPNSGVDGGQGSLVIVGNIHVLFNPKRGDVKLGQVRVLLESAHTLSEKYGGVPVTIAGDFNSTPKSDLYTFLSTSELDVASCNRATMSGQVEAGEGSPMAWMSQMGQSSSAGSPGADPQNEYVKRWHWTPEELWAATGSTDCTQLRHSLHLRSAYTQIKGEAGCRDAQGEPLVTSFHKKFMGTVDYIWHTEGIDTVKVLDTLPVNVLQRARGLPSGKWGSDHLALACELAFLPGFKPNPS